MGLTIKLVFVSFIFLKSSTLVFSQRIDIQDSLALVDLYDSTNGNSWLNNYNWKTTAPVSTWFGVYVVNNRVVALNLAGNNVDGYLPESIGNLNQLKSFYLLNNPIAGSLPGSMGNLTALEDLNISATYISGSFPESMGNLKKLGRLWFYGSGISGTIPTSFKNLTNLFSIDAEGAKLSGDFSNSLPVTVALSILDNKFNFDGIEQWVGKTTNAFDYSQQSIIPLIEEDNKLMVSAGGTLANNTFKWYNGNVVVATIIGDSTFTPSSYGLYHVEVTNAVATELTLISEAKPNAKVTCCANQANSITSYFSGIGYKWQMCTDGFTYQDISDGSIFQGTSYKKLDILNTPSSWYGRRFRCIVNGQSVSYFTLVFRNTWLAVSTLWSDVNNWSCHAVPDENTDVVINSGNVVVDHNATVRSLKVESGASVTVNPGITFIISQK